MVSPHSRPILSTQPLIHLPPNRRQWKLDHLDPGIAGVGRRRSYPHQRKRFVRDAQPVGAEDSAAIAQSFAFDKHIPNVLWKEEQKKIESISGTENIVNHICMNIQF